MISANRTIAIILDFLPLLERIFENLLCKAYTYLTGKEKKKKRGRSGQKEGKKKRDYLQKNGRYPVSSLISGERKVWVGKVPGVALAGD